MANNNKIMKIQKFLKFVFVKINVCENKINLYLRNKMCIRDRYYIGFYDFQK